VIGRVFFIVVVSDGFHGVFAGQDLDPFEDVVIDEDFDIRRVEICPEDTKEAVFVF
jgi:hypothetical protein